MLNAAPVRGFIDGMNTLTKPISDPSGCVAVFSSLIGTEISRGKAQTIVYLPKTGVHKTLSITASEILGFDELCL